MAATSSFLFDECLSAELVKTAHSFGYPAHHVLQLGKLGESDRDLAVWAFANDFVLVTNNRRDFLRIYAQLEIHPGLVVLLPSAPIHDQQRLFTRVIEETAARNDLVNVLVQVDLAGNVSIREFSKHA